MLQDVINRMDLIKIRTLAGRGGTCLNTEPKARGRSGLQSEFQASLSEKKKN